MEKNTGEIDRCGFPSKSVNREIRADDTERKIRKNSNGNFIRKSFNTDDRSEFVKLNIIFVREFVTRKVTYRGRKQFGKKYLC